MKELKTAVVSLLNALSDDPEDYPDMSMHRMIQERMGCVQEALKKSSQNNVVAYVTGGTLTGANADDPDTIGFEVFDVDNKKAEGLSSDEIEKEWEEVSKDMKPIY